MSEPDGRSPLARRLLPDGEEPDPRFTLANERTFLAWMRTALAFVAGGKAAVPILAVAQLLGNLSRAGFGWRDVHWRPVLLFSLGAVPASLAGSRLFVAMPPTWPSRAIGALLLAVVALRRAGLGARGTPGWLLAPAGAAVGLGRTQRQDRRAADGWGGRAGRCRGRGLSAPGSR